ncbi:hypothetical protein PHYBOEH_008795 [Phytophthora boehmeriae]|uniref:RxLR effector protein n=1 Tax=Phytophthora boehmeriae TaxID=109152 RepID=A0A8T1VYQ4_9STRA|nr:hypothetical protein PHYBOEH_008795 [Phytophthora boehmeriae]
MRQAYFVLLLLAIVFASISSASSAAQESEQNDILMLTENIERLTRLLDGDYDSTTRSLRASTMKGDDLSVEEEERAAVRLPGWINKVSNAMTKMSTGLNKIPTKTLNTFFSTMGKAKITPAKLQQYFKITDKSGGKFAFLQKYTTFWNTKFKAAA